MSPEEHMQIEMHAKTDAMERVNMRVRITQLEAALVALIDAVDAQDKKAIESALFVGRGLTF